MGGPLRAETREHEHEQKSFTHGMTACKAALPEVLARGTAGTVVQDVLHRGLPDGVRAMHRVTARENLSVLQ